MWCSCREKAASKCHGSFEQSNFVTTLRCPHRTSSKLGKAARIIAPLLSSDSAPCQKPWNLKIGSRFLGRLRSDQTRSLLYLKNELGATLNVLRTGFSWGIRGVCDCNCQFVTLLNLDAFTMFSLGWKSGVADSSPNYGCYIQHSLKFANCKQWVKEKKENDLWEYNLNFYKIPGALQVRFNQFFLWMKYEWFLLRQVSTNVPDSEYVPQYENLRPKNGIVLQSFLSSVHGLCVTTTWKLLSNLSTEFVNLCICSDIFLYRNIICPKQNC